MSDNPTPEPAPLPKAEVLAKLQELSERPPDRNGNVLFGKAEE